VLKAREAEQFQPVRVCLTGQELGWSFADPIGVLTA